jgi:hypothetical protein
MPARAREIIPLGESYRTGGPILPNSLDEEAKVDTFPLAVFLCEYGAGFARFTFSSLSVTVWQRFIMTSMSILVCFDRQQAILL